MTCKSWTKDEKKKGPKEKDEEERSVVKRCVRDKLRGKDGKGKREMSLSWKREKRTSIGWCVGSGLA